MSALAELAKRVPLSLDDKDRREAVRDCWPRALWWEEDELRSRMPAAVARPRSEEEALSLMAWAADAGRPLIPRGGGSGVCGAAIPELAGAVVVETAGLDRISEVETGPGGPVLTAQAGVFGGALEAKLAPLGLSTGHSPASLAISTVGGWIATASHGHHSSFYGGFAERVLSLKAVLPGGEVRSWRGAGAWAGSEGTLGLILEARLPLVRAPERHARAFEFRSMREGLELLSRLAASGEPPWVARLYDGPDRRLLGPDSGGGSSARAQAWLLRWGAPLRRTLDLAAPWRPLLVLLHASEPASRRAEALAREAGARGLGPGPAERWWGRRFHPGFDRVRTLRRRGAFADTLDVWTPWDRATEVYERVGRALGRRVFWTAHASHPTTEGVCLYFSFAGSFGAVEELLAAYDASWAGAIEACLGAGGRPNHHHNFGAAKRPWLAETADPRWLKACRALKSGADPGRIMNPGKLDPAAAALLRPA